MNENHNHDKALEDAIERVVHGKKASGNELLDTLGAAKPKANPAFMANLEERLMAELSSKERELKMEKRKERPGKFGRWPLTMAAAVFAILLVGGFALFMQQSPNSEASGIAMNPVTAVVAVQAMIPGTVIEADMVEMQTFTPDADLDQVMLIQDVNLVIGRTSQSYVSVGEPLLVNHLRADMNVAMVPVVIAVQDIPEGREITPDMITVIVFPASNVPNGAFVDDAAVIGMTARTTIYQEEIILERKIAEISVETNPDAFQLTATSIVQTATAMAQENCAESPGSIPYEVQTGDTLFSIAELHNVSVRDIVAINCLERVEDIIVGDILRIPASGEADPFSLTATAIIATATASASGEIGQAAIVLPSAPEVVGCHNENARIFYPLNGQVLSGPVEIRAIANNESFQRSTIEIAGPSTNEAFIVTMSLSQAVILESTIGQFVPAAYEPGEYKLRLNTFNEMGNQVGTCTITIYISNDTVASAEGQLRPVVIAVQDIPMHTVITEDMVMLSYWPDAAAMQFAMDNAGQWYLGNLEGVVGMRSRDFIPAFEPISSSLLGRNTCPDEGCVFRPESGIAVAIPNIDNSVHAFLVGQSVDVVVSFNFVDNGDGTAQISSVGDNLTMVRLVVDAQVLWVGSNPPNGFWSENLDPVLSSDENLIILGVSIAEKTSLDYVIDADLPIMVVPHLEGVEADELEHSSSEIESSEPYISMMVWMDALALSFSPGQHVDAVGQFVYLNAEGQFEGMIRHRMGANMIVVDVEAGEGEMAAYALVSLGFDETYLRSGQVIPTLQGILQTNSDVLASWTLVPHNPELGESTLYFLYSDLAEPMPVEASSISNGHYYVGLPNLQLESTAGGLTVGDTVHLILEDGQAIEAQLSYIGASIYAPFVMQPVLDEYRTENPRVMVFEVSSAEEANTINSFVATGQLLKIERQP